MNEEDYLQLSGIQHFAFCKRQWELIHIDGIWLDNGLTVSGDLFHKNAHDNSIVEFRNDILMMHEVHLRSDALHISGMTDVVEFHPDSDGIELNGYPGKWIPFPIEYKHGNAKSYDADSLQVAAEAMCLEEMLHCTIKEAALFYGKTRHRKDVEITNELCNKVKTTVNDMFEMYNNHGHADYTYQKICDSCSLYEICQPKLNKDVDSYIRGKQ